MQIKTPSWLTGLLLSLPLLTGLAFLESLLAPRAELWERWTRSNSQSQFEVDHSAWREFLARYLLIAADGINRVRYGELDTAARAGLADYVAGLEATQVSSLNRAEQKAYWINLYNARTVLTVAEHFPVSSIRQIKLGGGAPGSGPWAKKLIRVEGELLSLNDIEHRILRPIWSDPRVHYALNCASLGCPNLLPVPFTAARAESMLEQAARQFVNHPRGVTFDERGRLQASSIYNWFQSDFGASDRSVIEHLERYAAPDLAAKLAVTKKIDKYHYDWGLNVAR